MIKMKKQAPVQISLIRQGRTEKAEIYFKTTQSDKYKLKILFSNNDRFEVTDNDYFS